MSGQANGRLVSKKGSARPLLVICAVCVVAAIAVGAWLYVRAQRQAEDWVEGSWNQVRQGEPRPGPAQSGQEQSPGSGQSGQDPILARKAVLAKLPDVAMATPAGDASVEDESRRVPVARAEFTVIPPGGWTLKEMGSGMPPYYESPEGDTLELGPFSIYEANPFASAEALAPALLGTPTVLEKGAVTLKAGRAALYVAKGKSETGDVMQMMQCVFYGDRGAMTIILYASEASFPKGRAAMEKVMRTIRENG